MAILDRCWQDNNYFGKLLSLNNSDKTSVLYDAGVTKVSYSRNYKYYVVNSKTHKEFGSLSLNDYTNWTATNFAFINSFNNKEYILSTDYNDIAYPQNSFEGFIPDNFFFANSDQEFTAWKGYTFYRYLFTSDTVYLKDTLAFKYSPICAVYSTEDKFYLVSNPNHTIELYYLDSKELIKTYRLLDSSVCISIALLTGSDYFLALCSNGTVKRFPYLINSDSLEARFTAKPLKCRVNTDVEFFNYSSGKPDGFEWDFGDGNYSYKENPAHTYSSSGKYNVKLTIYKGSEQKTYQKDEYIQVSDLKTSFNADNRAGLPPLAVQFTNTTIQNYHSSYWDFGDGQTSTEINPSHIYSKPGIYPVKLIVTDSLISDTLAVNNYITVDQLPLNDSLFESESFWTYDENIESIKCLKSYIDGYYLETVSNNYVYLSHLNSNYDTIWTRRFFANKFHSTIQQISDGSIFVMGNEENNIFKHDLNKISPDGNIIYTIEHSINNQYHFFDYLALDTVIYTFTNIPSFGHYEAPKMNLNEYNNLGYRQQSKECFILSNMGESYIFSLKAIIINDSLYFILNTYYKENVESNPFYCNSFGVPGDIYPETMPNAIIKNLKNQIINDFKAMNRYNFIYIQDNNKITCIYPNKITHQQAKWINWEIDNLSASLNTLCPLNDTSFIVGGSKDGKLWYAYLDTSGNVLQQQTIENRYGSIENISKNNDGSLLFSCLIYKNSTVIGEPVNKVISGQTVTTTVTDNYAAYIMRSKVTPNSVPTGKFDNVEVNVYPNPADNYLYFDISHINTSTYNITIYDILGNIMYSADRNNSTLQIDLSAYSTGVYYYKIATTSSHIQKTGMFQVAR